MLSMKWKTWICWLVSWILAWDWYAW